MKKCNPIILINSKYHICKCITILYNNTQFFYNTYHDEFTYENISQVIAKVLKYCKANGFYIPYNFSVGVKWYDIIFVDEATKISSRYPYLPTK